MIEQISMMFGIWTWIVFGLVLLGAEILLPSTFLLWPGIAALIVGVITLLLGENNSLWAWQTQMLVFLALSILITIVGRNLMKRKDWNASENPTLNKRGETMVGQTAVLSDAITNGFGRIKVGDSTWRVSGDDLSKGTKVKIVSSDGATLHVEKIT
ncbi:MAG: NfeD family protein [Pseudomonadota bacterium]